MTMLYPKSIFNKSCYKGTALYLTHFCKTIFQMGMLSYIESIDRNFPSFLKLGPGTC